MLRHREETGNYKKSSGHLPRTFINRRQFLLMNSLEAFNLKSRVSNGWNFRLFAQQEDTGILWSV